MTANSPPELLQLPPMTREEIRQATRQRETDAIDDANRRANIWMAHAQRLQGELDAAMERLKSQDESLRGFGIVVKVGPV